MNIIQDSLLSIYQIRKLLKRKYNRIRREGYSLARLKLKNITKKGNTIFSQLNSNQKKQRRLL
jgi:hypothetical protein